MALRREASNILGNRPRGGALTQRSTLFAATRCVLVVLVFESSSGEVDGTLTRFILPKQAADGRRSLARSAIVSCSNQFARLAPLLLAARARQDERTPALHDRRSGAVIGMGSLRGNPALLGQRARGTYIGAAIGTEVWRSASAAEPGGAELRYGLRLGTVWAGDLQSGGSTARLTSTSIVGKNAQSGELLTAGDWIGIKLHCEDDPITQPPPRRRKGKVSPQFHATERSTGSRLPALGILE